MKNFIKAALLGCTFVGPVQADFAPGYTLDLWNAPITDGGSVSFLNDANASVLQNDPSATQVVMVGNDSATVDANQDFTFAATVDGEITFDWSYATTDADGPEWDPFGFILNGLFTQLTDDLGASNQSGNANFVVSVGDVFGFRLNTVDGQFGAGSATTSNFSVSPVPLPASLGLLGFAFGGLSMVQRRRKLVREIA